MALEEASYVGGRIVAKYVIDAHSVAKVFTVDGQLVGQVALPGLGTVEGFFGEGKETETFFSYTDYLTPPQVYRYDVTANKSALWRKAALAESTDAYVTEQVFYLSKDGTRVPMFITHRRDMAKDGRPAVSPVRVRRLQRLAHPDIPRIRARVARNGWRLRRG